MGGVLDNTSLFRPDDLKILLWFSGNEKAIRFDESDHGKAMRPSVITFC